MSKKGGKDGGGSMDKEKELGKLYKELGALRCSPESHYTEILKVVSAVNTLVLFFCPCCANFWSVYAHRMCIGAYFWLQLC